MKLQPKDKEVYFLCFIAFAALVIYFLPIFSLATFELTPSTLGVLILFAVALIFLYLQDRTLRVIFFVIGIILAFLVWSLPRFSCIAWCPDNFALIDKFTLGSVFVFSLIFVWSMFNNRMFRIIFVGLIGLITLYLLTAQ